MRFEVDSGLLRIVSTAFFVLALFFFLLPWGYVGWGGYYAAYGGAKVSGIELVIGTKVIGSDGTWMLAPFPQAIAVALSAFGGVGLFFVRTKLGAVLRVAAGAIGGVSLLLLLFVAGGAYEPELSQGVAGPQTDMGLIILPRSGVWLEGGFSFTFAAIAVAFHFAIVAMQRSGSQGVTGEPGSQKLLKALAAWVVGIVLVFVVMMMALPGCFFRDCDGEPTFFLFFFATVVWSLAAVRGAWRSLIGKLSQS